MSCIKGCLWYEKENGVKATQQFVPKKYKIQFGVAQVDLDGVDNSVHTQPNINHTQPNILKEEPGLYCFLLRCKRDEAKPFMEWVVETVLQREVRPQPLKKKWFSDCSYEWWFTRPWQPNTSHQIWKRGITSTKRCKSSGATKMLR